MIYLGDKNYDKTDAAKETGSSTSKVSESWHDARTDSGARSGSDKEHFKEAPSWSKGNDRTESGIPYFPKGKEYNSEKTSSGSDDSGK